MAYKVFVSYHHENDQKKADYLRNTYGENNTLLDRSLDEAYKKRENSDLVRNSRKRRERNS